MPTKFGFRSKEVFFIAAGPIHCGKGKAGPAVTKEAKTKIGQLHSETSGAKESKGADDIPSEIPFLSEQNIATRKCDESFHVKDNQNISLCKSPYSAHSNLW